MRWEAFKDRMAARPWFATNDLVWWALLIVGVGGPPVASWALGWPPPGP